MFNAKVKHYLHNAGIQNLAWPGNSPDLNPIENCWALLKRFVAKKNTKTKEGFKQAIKEVWQNEITTEYCQKLINSMPARIAAVITARGGHTKY